MPASPGSQGPAATATSAGSGQEVTFYKYRSLPLHRPLHRPPHCPLHRPPPLLLTQQIQQPLSEGSTRTRCRGTGPPHRGAACHSCTRSFPESGRPEGNPHTNIRAQQVWPKTPDPQLYPKETLTKPQREPFSWTHTFLAKKLRPYYFKTYKSCLICKGETSSGLKPMKARSWNKIKERRFLLVIVDAGEWWSMVTYIPNW